MRDVPGFAAVEQQPRMPDVEQRVLRRWRERDIVARALADTDPTAPLFIFYEGPPTANGTPGVHHVEPRVFKDVFPRHRAMGGFRVPRKAGWDCHGIPVELQIERELGFDRKSDIEDYGIAAFNARCRESVLRHVDEFERLTERIAFWVDTTAAYRTMDDTYIESVWWSLKQLWDGGLIYSDFRVVPYCPRCGTTLSDHEVAQGYAEIDDPSVYVRFPVTADGALRSAGASLLVWTTTPWTLVSNVAIAIGPDLRYVLAKASEDDYPVVIAADLVETVLGDAAEVLRTVDAAELRGLTYRGPFDFVRPPAGHRWREVVEADYVSTAEGTGLVHLAPAFGADDLEIARAHDMPVVNPVDAEGRFEPAVAPYAGMFVKDADRHIIDDLRREGLLFRATRHRHSYPFCWRCGTPLLYYAKPSWYIATTKVRDRMLAENAEVDWHPPHIRDGRYGDWLVNNVDWALSRERYWGTPLPLWRCTTCREVTAIGARADLSDLTGRDLSALDPHRPYVDDVTFDCPHCGDGVATRVPEVIDAWYDSGAMPFAQFGYPHVPGSRERFAQMFPADFISEAIDQTRGWFYSLMAISTLLFDRNSYRTVVCLGHIVDADGRKMSKSLGNAIDPWSIIDQHGADALRWMMLTEGSPWVPRRVSSELVGDVVRRFLLTLWNTYYFFVTYARLDGWLPADAARAPAREHRDVLDRWILAELADTVTVVDERLQAYDTTAAGARLQTFVDDLSNWYIRRSRRRFWSAGRLDDAATGSDKLSAYATLHECLVTVAALLAPFTPFLSDELYENLVRSVDVGAPDSVHLLRFPRADGSASDDVLRSAMAAARRVVELGRRARNDAGIGVRQPLRQALVTLPEDTRAQWDLIAGVIADELNVQSVRLLERAADTVTLRLKPNFRALGPSFGARTPAVAAAIQQADAAPVARALSTQGSATIEVDGAPLSLQREHVMVLEEARSGWGTASEGGYSVALDLALDAELRSEGLAREVVRAVNDLRKRHALSPDQRITLRIDTEPEVASAIQTHLSTIAGDVLATRIELGPIEHGDQLEIGGIPARVALRQVVAQ